MTRTQFWRLAEVETDGFTVEGENKEWLNEVSERSNVMLQVMVSTGSDCQPKAGIGEQCEGDERWSEHLRKLGVLKNGRCCL